MHAEPFYAEVKSKEEGIRLLATLAEYDLYQLEHRIKPDYANIGGLERYESGEWQTVDELA